MIAHFFIKKDLNPESSSSFEQNRLRRWKETHAGLKFSRLAAAT